MGQFVVDDRGAATREQQVCRGASLRGGTGRPYGGGGEQRGDTGSEAEREITAEDRAQHLDEQVGAGEPAAELGGYELGAQPRLDEEPLGGGGRFVALVGGEEGAQAVGVGGVVGVAQQSFEPGGPAQGVGLLGGTPRDPLRVDLGGGHGGVDQLLRHGTVLGRGLNMSAKRPGGTSSAHPVAAGAGPFLCAGIQRRQRRSTSA